MTPSPKARNLPKIGRSPKEVQFTLMTRDLTILQALGRYRYLRTGQIARLVFPDAKTVQSARRRLKYLYHAGYVGRIQPMTDSALGHAEMAYYLERAGAEMLEDDNLPRFSSKGLVKPQFLRHALEVSEARLCLEQAVATAPGVDLHRVVMDHELKARTEEAVGRRRYRLFDEVQDPIGKRKLVVHPDLMFVLKAEAAPGRVFQRLFFVEIDRGTEGLRVISDKLTGYHLYRREAVFKKFGAFDGFRLLLQTNSAKRTANFAKLLEIFGSDLDAWVTEDRLVNPTTLLHGDIWQRAGHNALVPILKGGPTEAAR